MRTPPQAAAYLEQHPDARTFRCAHPSVFVAHTRHTVRLVTIPPGDSRTVEAPTVASLLDSRLQAARIGSVTVQTLTAIRALHGHVAIHHISATGFRCDTHTARRDIGQPAASAGGPVVYLDAAYLNEAFRYEPGTPVAVWFARTVVRFHYQTGRPVDVYAAAVLRPGRSERVDDPPTKGAAR